MPQIERTIDTLTDSNSYILYTGGACVVIDPNDPQVPLRILEERCLKPQYIFLTHEHCDHTAGLERLREKYPEAVLHISRLCNEGIQNKRLNMSMMMEVYLHFAGKPGQHYEPFTCAPAEEVFEGASSLSWRGHTFRFVPLPGHSPGSTGIFLDENTFFCGDYLLPGREVTLRLPGGSEADYEAVTKPFLQSLPAGLHIYPGHGGDFLLTEEKPCCTI